jgi:LacI family transcriptional regulator
MFKSLGWLRQNGLLSDQIKLVVNDDYEYLDFFSPAMTAIRQPVEQLGAGGIEMLLSLLEGHPPERPHLLLPGKLVER